ncbi:hypothetical protein J6590_105966, partial [Homalodisca vitripennis]
SPLSERTIQRLVENDYLSDSECNDVARSSHDESEQSDADDTDLDPRFEPNNSGSTVSTTTRPVLSSSDEDSVENPRPGPSR